MESSGFKWTPKQRQFVEEYILDLNATAAARRAGYAAGSAKVRAAELMQTPEVQEAIQARMNARSERTEITADRTLSEIGYMAFYDPAEFVAVSNPNDIKDLPEEVRRAIVGWSWDKLGNFVLKLASKTTALDMLAKHLSIYAPTKVEATISVASKILEEIDGTSAGLPSDRS